MGVPDPAALGDLWGGWGGGTGTSIGGGWSAAPDMASAGYGLPDAPGWWARNIGTINKDDVTKALGSLGAASKDAQSGTGKGAGSTQQAAVGGGAGTGRVAGNTLSPLLQLLMQNRNALLASATAGPGGQARPQGLLGV